MKINSSLCFLISLFLCFFCFHLFLELPFGLFDFENLAGIGGDDLVFGIGGDDFDGVMLLAGEKQAFAHAGFEQKITFALGKFEGLGNSINAGSGLLH